MFKLSHKAQALSLFLFFIINVKFISGTNQEDAQPSIFTAIKDLFNKSLDIQQEEEVVVDAKKKLKLQIEQPSHDKMCYLVMDQMCKLADQFIAHPISLDKKFLKKMELFAGDEHPKNSLLNKINETETVFGYVMLARQLGQPVYSAQVLRDRQRIIQYLLNNETLFVEIQEQLKIMKATESYFISYFQKENAINEELFKKVYWGTWFNKLNDNEWGLEAGVRLGNLYDFVGLAMIPYMVSSLSAGVKNWQSIIKQEKFSGIKNLGQSVIDLVDPRKKAYKNGGFDERVNEMSASLQQFQEVQEEFVAAHHANDFQRVHELQREMEQQGRLFLGNLLNVIPQTLGDIAYVINNTSGGSKYLLLGMITSFAGMQGYMTYNSLQNAFSKQTIINHLQIRMTAVASYINALKKLAAIINTDPVLSRFIDVFAFNNLFTEQSSLSSDAKKLLALLDHNTFAGEASVFSLSGRVLAAHRLMQKVKEELVPECAFGGQIDAYLSTAKVFKKHQDTLAQFCFPEYIEKSLIPLVKAEEFWNLFIDANSVVVNNLLIGSDNPNNIILTGPNTGGKSTVIKGLLINIFLAQTLGIAPAKSLQFTLFANLNCYLNITDDLTAGTSLFKAEVLRAKALINSVRNLNEGEFSFTIIDEVFSGTSPKEGEEAALMFAQELGAISNSICTIATHFPRLTDELSDAHYKNYKVTVYKDAEDKWMRPYKLEEGKSLLNIAMDLLREEGIFN